MERTVRNDEPKDEGRSRFAQLPAGPDRDRLVTEHESRPDPTADALARAEFVERAGGRTSG